MTTAAGTQPTQPAAAAPAPAEVIDADETAKLWSQFAAKHTDPNGSGAASEPPGDDDPQDDPEPLVDPAEGDDPPPPKTDPQPEPAPAAIAEPAPTPENKTDPAPVAAAPPKADTSAAPAPPAADDLWVKASVDPRTADLKAAWDAAPAAARPAIEAAQRRLLMNGREIAQLRSDRSRKPSAPPAAAPAPAGGKKDEPTYDFSKNAKWAKAKEDYPDAMQAVEEMITEALGSVDKRVDGKLAPLQAASAAHAGVVEDIELAEQNKLLHTLQPDYTQVVLSEGFKPAFIAWIENQPQAVKDMATANGDHVTNANEASTVFKLFRADTGFGKRTDTPPAPAGTSAAPATVGTPPAAAGNPATPPANSRRRNQLAGSAAVTTRGVGVSAQPSDENDSDYWYKHFSARHADPEARTH